MSSVISANRFCEGRISDPLDMSFEDGANGLAIGEEGLVSERMVDGVIGLSMIEAIGMPDRLGDLGVKDIARDMSSTSKGLTCFPSPLV